MEYTGTLPYADQTDRSLDGCIDWAYSRGSMEARGLAYYLSKQRITGYTQASIEHARTMMALPTDPKERAMLSWVLDNLKA